MLTIYYFVFIFKGTQKKIKYSDKKEKKPYKHNII